MLSFKNVLEKHSSLPDDIFLTRIPEQNFRRAWDKESLREMDFLTLLGPCSDNQLEAMARRASDLTLRHFGRVIQLYVPLYLSNYCVNQCLYCGFSARRDIPRKKLKLHELEREALSLSQAGHRHILLLSGEDTKIFDLDYLATCIKLLKKYFPTLSIEVYPLSLAGYTRMQELGIENLTLYQETYNRELYAELHPAGPKRDFDYRLGAPERALRAGIRSVNIGPLLGLSCWQKECFLAGLHAQYLERIYPAAELALSLPRMQDNGGEFHDVRPVADRDLVQMIVALRLFMPRLGLSISTRERPRLRDSLLPLGVTRMSAGSRTSVGAYSSLEESERQFTIHDTRSLEEIKAMLKSRGYQPVCKDGERLDDEN